MENLPICRICLNTDVQHVVKNSQLQEVYEKLTTIPFQADMRPLVLCYICFAQLKTTHRFMLKCLKAEELLAQMLTNVDGVLTLIQRSSLKQLTISSVEQIIYDSTDQNGDIIGLETLITYEDDVKTEEHPTIQELPETALTIKLEPNNEQSLSDLGDNVPLNIETATEQEGVQVTVQNGDIIGLETLITYEDDVKTEEHPTIQELPETAHSIKLEPVNEQSPSDLGDNELLNIDTATEQEEVRVKNIQRDRLKKGKPKIKPDVKKSTQVHKNAYRYSDNAKNEDCKPKRCITTIIVNGDNKIPISNDNIEINMNGNVEKKNAFQQNVCMQGCPINSDLIRFERIHTGVKPYVCNVCNKGFARKNYLVSHKLIHTGEKPYVCNVCNKGFNLRGNLVKHKLIHTCEKPYVCNMCNKGFNYRSHLVAHKLNHTGEKPYVCNVCNRGFTRKADLVKHELIHTGEKPYVCNVCNKGFARKNNLVIHNRIHTDEKPYVFNLCNKGFTRKGELVKHKRIM